MEPKKTKKSISQEEFDYDIDEQIGCGTLGEEIWRAHHKTTEEKVCLMLIETNETSEEVIPIFKKQIKRLKKCAGLSNIIQIREVIDKNLVIYNMKYSFIVAMDFYDIGLLDDFYSMLYFNGLPIAEAIRYISEILDALEVLKKKKIKILHFTLKHAILTNKKKVSLCSLGYEAKLDPNYWDEYTSPETLESSGGDKSIIWSLGVAFFQLLFGKFPFDKKDTEKNFKKYIEDNISRLFIDLTHKNKKEELVDILSKMLTINPKDRIGWEDLNALIKSLDLNKYDNNNSKKSIIDKTNSSMSAQNNFNEKNLMQGSQFEKDFKQEYEKNAMQGVQFGKIFNQEFPETKQKPLYIPKNDDYFTNFLNFIGYFKGFISEIEKGIHSQANSADELILNLGLNKCLFLLIGSFWNSVKQKKNIFQIENFEKYSNDKDYFELSKKIEYLSNDAYFQWNIVLESFKSKDEDFRLSEIETFKMTIGKLIKNDDIRECLNDFKEFLQQYFYSKNQSVVVEKNSKSPIIQEIKILDFINEINIFSLNKGKQNVFNLKKIHESLESMSINELQVVLNQKYEEVFLNQ